MCVYGVCVCLCVQVHINAMLSWPVATDPFLSDVTDGCELSKMGAGNWTCVF